MRANPFYTDGARNWIRTIEKFRRIVIQFEFHLAHTRAYMYKRIA